LSFYRLPLNQASIPHPRTLSIPADIITLTGREQGASRQRKEDSGTIFDESDSFDYEIFQLMRHQV
jgi:hypothetical protein